MVQWLGLRAFTAEGTGWETKILQATAQHGLKKKIFFAPALLCSFLIQNW